MEHKYHIVLVKDGVEIARRATTLDPEDLIASEYRGGNKAKELMRDAIAHAGLWSSYRDQIDEWAQAESRYFHEEKVEWTASGDNARP